MSVTDSKSADVDLLSPDPYADSEREQAELDKSFQSRLLDPRLAAAINQIQDDNRPIVDSSSDVHESPNVSSIFGLSPDLAYLVDSLNKSVELGGVEFSRDYIATEAALLRKATNLLHSNIALVFSLGVGVVVLILMAPLFASTDYIELAGLMYAVGASVAFLAVLGARMRALKIALAFVEIRHIKIKNDALIEDRQLQQGATIMKSVKDRAAALVQGDNSIVIFGDNNEARVTVHFASNKQAAELAALIVAFAEEFGNVKARKDAEAISKELAKEKPDKGKLFELWNSISSILPDIKAIVEITAGIAKIFSGP